MGPVRNLFSGCTDSQHSMGRVGIPGRPPQKKVHPRSSNLDSAALSGPTMAPLSADQHNPFLQSFFHLHILGCHIMVRRRILDRSAAFRQSRGHWNVRRQGYISELYTSDIYHTLLSLNTPTLLLILSALYILVVFCFGLM